MVDRLDFELWDIHIIPVVEDKPGYGIIQVWGNYKAVMPIATFGTITGKILNSLRGVVIVALFDRDRGAA